MKTIDGALTEPSAAIKEPPMRADPVVPSKVSEAVVEVAKLVGDEVAK